MPLLLMWWWVCFPKYVSIFFVLFTYFWQMQIPARAPKTHTCVAHNCSHSRRNTDIYSTTTKWMNDNKLTITNIVIKCLQVMGILPMATRIRKAIICMHLHMQVHVCWCAILQIMNSTHAHSPHTHINTCSKYSVRPTLLQCDLPSRF